MDSEFEKLMKNSRPEGAPPRRDSVLNAAKEEWTQDSIEHRLESAEVCLPENELRAKILDNARSQWRAGAKPIRFKRWILATAAVLLFAVCTSWYDNHQNASLQAMIRSGDTPRIREEFRPVELLNPSDFGVGNAFLLGTKSISSIDTPKNEIAWRYIQDKELNEQ